MFASWDLHGVFTVTFDNASANDSTIDYLMEDVHVNATDITVDYLKDQVFGINAILNSKFLQVRCAAHVLALIVKADLKEYHMPIKRITEMVKYALSSPAMLNKFMDCAEK